MINPASIMKIMSLKNKFNDAHPKFSAFLQHIFTIGVTEGTVIEITVTKPGEEPVTSNLKVTQADLELLQEIKELASSR